MYDINNIFYYVIQQLNVQVSKNVKKLLHYLCCFTIALSVLFCSDTTENKGDIYHCNMIYSLNCVTET